MSDNSGPACAIIVAAGRSERMAGANKIFTALMGRPLIVWTIGAFHACDAIDNIVLVTSPDAIDRLTDLIVEWRFDRKVTAVIAGGATRQESVAAGLKAVPEAAIVAVHDGARPLVTPALIEQGVKLARETGAALCAIPSRDTVKEVSAPPGGHPPVVTATPQRASMWLAQTPQCFDRELLLRAHAAASGDATDDAALVEALGHPVSVVEGSPANIKVTTPDDLTIAEALLRKRFQEF